MMCVKTAAQNITDKILGSDIFYMIKINQIHLFNSDFFKN